LRRARRDQRVGALRQRLGDEELELACLVAPGREAEQVVALDPHLRATEGAGEVGQEFERGGAGCVAAARDAGEVHRGIVNPLPASRRGRCISRRRPSFRRIALAGRAGASHSDPIATSLETS
jgi:hypothetical protein